MLSIRLEDLRKVYPSGAMALEGISLAVDAGQCLALVGPSGCGKTTLLRIIAGLESASGGMVLLGSEMVNAVAPHRRRVAMVFQRPAIVPGHTVRENLAFSWTVEKRNPWNLIARPRYSSAQIEALDQMAQLLGISGIMDRPARELSGGEQQRVALGRALLRRAPVCLLDEPLGHLETRLRLQLRRDLRLLSRRFPATMIHVTHDPVEALAVGDRVAVLRAGRLQQIASPPELVRRPVNRFVAEFCHPHRPVSFLEGQLHRVQGEVRLVAASWLQLPVPEAVWPALADASAVTVGIDGRSIEILPKDAAEAPPSHIIGMEVALTEFAPEGLCVTCRRDGIEVTGYCSAQRGIASGSRAELMISLKRAFWFETATGKTLWAPAG
jgi:multiple sugar transport system ATP-binding protein